MIPDNKEKYMHLYNYVKNGLSIEDIFRKYSYTTEYTIYHLYNSFAIENDVNTYLKDYYNQFKIKDNKVLIITDTHLAGPYGRLEYVKYIYQYAKANNYKYIVHLGDLIEGQCNPTIKPMPRSQQLKYITSNYPYDKDITTYFISGNHDGEKYDIIKELKQLNVIYIGTNMSYVYFDDTSRIKVIHDALRKDYLPLYNHDIILKGHTHIYKTGNHKFNCRPLGDFTNSTYSEYSKPGFETIILDQDGYFFQDYLVDENGILQNGSKIRINKMKSQ